MECKTCDSIKENINIILETEYLKVRLADNQYHLGRCIIDLKQHISCLSELKKKEILDFLEIVKKLEKAIKKAFNATMFNYSCLMNNAYKLETPNPHVHWHLHPRYKNPVKFEDIIFEDKEFAHHYDNKKILAVSDEIKRKIIEKIKENL